MCRYVRVNLLSGQAALTSLPNSRFSPWKQPEPILDAKTSKLVQMRNLSRLLASLIGVVLLAITPVAGAQQPEPSGWIEGKIFDEQTGQPLVNWARVKAVPDTGPKAGNFGETDGEGAYRIGPLPAGTYRLEFQDARLQGYLTEWWQDQPDAASADVVEVADGQVVSGIDFFVGMPVDEGGWITGVATDAETGDPVSTIVLIVLDLDGNRVSPLTDGPQFNVRSGADGVYRVGNLGTGSYKLRFEDGGNFVYPGAWYGGTDFESAAIVNVTLGVETSGIDISLTLRDEGGWITGVVTDAETGDPVSLISLIVLDLDGNRVSPLTYGPQFNFRSGADGVYRVGNLGTGSYKLQFEDGGHFVYQPAWYGGTDFESAAIVNVTFGVEISGIDISVTLGGATQPPTAVGPPAQVLPFTGLATQSIAVFGFGALLLGLGLIVATTRLRSLATDQAKVTGSTTQPRKGGGDEYRT